MKSIIRTALSTLAFAASDTAAGGATSPTATRNRTSVEDIKALVASPIPANMNDQITALGEHMETRKKIKETMDNMFERYSALESVVEGLDNKVQDITKHISGITDPELKTRNDARIKAAADAAKEAAAAKAKADGEANKLQPETPGNE